MIATLGHDVKSLALSPLDLHITSRKRTGPGSETYNVVPGVMAYLTCAIICLALGEEYVFILS